MILQTLYKLPNYFGQRFSSISIKTEYPLETDRTQTIDLRSDTVTRPSVHLRKLMANAKV